MRHARPPESPSARRALLSPGAGPALLLVAVFLASLLGIVSRSEHQLATFWPTNALLLGLLIRNPALARRPLAWLAALAGYLGADLATGGAPGPSLALALANLAGVAAGAWLAGALALHEQTLTRPADMLWLLLVCAFASLWAGMAGTLASGDLLAMSAMTAFGFWFSAELVSYLALLPAVLTAPTPRQAPTAARRVAGHLRHRPGTLLPLLVLAGSVALATWMGGPGALMLPVPALLWCALTFRVFSTSVITMAMCLWALMAVATGALPLLDRAMDAHDTISLRIGVALMAVAPLTVAVVSAARHGLLLELDHAASHDSLTGLLGRGAFIDRAGARLQSLLDEGRPATLMMLDVDHFKQVNDRYGHAAGDRVLAAFAAHMRAAVRPQDLVGRVGGEEFAILLPDTLPADAAHIGERLLRLAAAEPVPLHDDARTTITASIGCVSATRGDGASGFEDLLRLADMALYRAKAEGRNRMVHTVLDPAPQPAG